jgi:hypothetical protein
LLNHKLKCQWCDALRSGYYEPGEMYLRLATPDGDEFSALGVLLDLIDPDGWSRLEGSNAYAWGEPDGPLPYTDPRREHWYQREIERSASIGIASGYVSTVPWQTLIRIGLPPYEKVFIPGMTDMLDTWSQDHSVAGLNDAGMPWGMLAAFIYTQL